MRPEERDAAHLWDMLEAAKDAVGIVRGLDPATFRRDRIRALALERSMEILGEAARHISESYRAAHPELPWREMVGLRNILAHEYGRIDHDRLFATAAKELPRLIVQVENLLPPAKE